MSLDEAKTSELLRRAAALLERGEWNQGAYFNAAGAMCVTGAIIKAVDLEGAHWRALALPRTMETLQFVCLRLLNVLEEQYPEFFDSDRDRSVFAVGRVAAWNDDPERSKAEVVAMLEKAAVRHEGALVSSAWSE